jgi:hypothetical protein
LVPGLGPLAPLDGGRFGLPLERCAREHRWLEAHVMTRDQPHIPTDDFFVGGLAMPVIRTRGQFSTLPGVQTPSWSRPNSIEGPLPIRQMTRHRRRALVEEPAASAGRPEKGE